MRYHHRPLAAYRLISTISFLCLLGAFILMLLVALSLPIIKAIYLLEVQAVTIDQPATSIATELRFGVWGVCATSVLNVPTLLTNDGECSKPRLGYDIPNDLIQLVGLNTSLVDAVLKGLLVVLVLHPIAAGLSFLTLFFSLFLASHGISIFTLILAIVTALVTSVVLAADLALVIVAKNKVPSLTNNGFVVNWGNGVWMVLTSLVLTWLAVIFLSARACFCCGVRRKDRRERF